MKKFIVFGILYAIVLFCSWSLCVEASKADDQLYAMMDRSEND